ncbi:hypothetical protein N0M98_25080 [Paenibacillus doosanensis]|uniref:phage tail assembly chaperone n=1 Tax=Paenibacillus doosanensis TaxID=1229154 RepID=UPI00218014CE|nr:hypothetical protein [Paenibacillus doosanensis]MCS7463383.1 hypothetical protein [Paenibacillus doosanensis]
MDALQAFLTADLHIEKDIPLQRLRAALRVQAIDSATLDRAREQATFVVNTGRKRERECDNEKFKAILITHMVVNVDFGNPDLLQKYNASDKVDCVRKALLPGEIERIVDAGLTLSGFGDTDETVDELKN